MHVPVSTVHDTLHSVPKFTVIQSFYLTSHYDASLEKTSFMQKFGSTKYKTAKKCIYTMYV